jgi:hypothetical protein
VQFKPFGFIAPIDFYLVFQSLNFERFESYSRNAMCTLILIENRNDPDLVQAFLKKWWAESDSKVPNLPLSLRLKGSGCHYNSIYNNIGIK